MTDWEEFLRQVVEDYRQRGYGLAPGDIESLPSDIRADFVAVGPDERVIVEVKRWSDLATDDRLQKTAEWVANHPGWRLELLLPPERATTNDPLIDMSEVRQRLTSADYLAAEHDYAAASLLLWSAVEALGRYLAFKAHIDLGSAGADDVINYLVSEGHVDRAAEPPLQGLASARNAVVHGLRFSAPETVYVGARPIVADLFESIALGGYR
jgi:hypothetical protein